ncbi:MAG TPA: efflux RND transporter periplasmic adaptor subunit [Terriglobales bacterium]|jgi:membrane fusion protein, multidrug efflux system|nr:efflux RND transporter periplasmic adaptor subunit [Terriglobales bacterium]
MSYESIGENTTTPESSNQFRRTAPKHRFLVLIAIAIFLVAGAAIAFALRLGERRSLARETEDLAVPTVIVIQPKPEPPKQEIVLPSTLEAYTESPIYARTSGYVARWYKDIGSRVQKGQLLADIDTPEVDQELLQARAAKNQADAQLNLAKTSAARWETLRSMDAVAQQETDERSSAYTQAQAALASSSANVRRLEQLESFKHVYAPFAGTITKRNTDIGALINAGNSGANQELFVLAQISPIRVYVDVPEIYAPSVRPGLDASIELPAFPGQRFSGKVVRTADAIDPATRTLRTEIDVPNRDGRLFPGSYGQVHFGVSVAVSRMSVPVNALLFRSEGPRAAVAGSDGKVHLKKVVIGQDYGTEVEILGGLDPSDSIVLNPSDSLDEGQQVHVMKVSSHS